MSRRPIHVLGHRPAGSLYSFVRANLLILPMVVMTCGQGCSHRDPFLAGGGSTELQESVDESGESDEESPHSEEGLPVAVPLTTDVSPLDRVSVKSPWFRMGASELESWDVHFRGNTPIGYTRFAVDPSHLDVSQTLRVESETKLRVRFGIEDVEQVLKIATVERPDGEMLSFEVQMKIAGSYTHCAGSAAEDHLRVMRTEEGKTQQRRVAWNRAIGGPFAIEQSLRRRPMQVGEIRQLDYLDPVVMDVVRVKMVAGPPLETADYEGVSRMLTEVTVTLELGDKQRTDLLWVDEAGAVWKSYSAQQETRIFRCRPETAIMMKSAGEWESMDKSPLPLGTNLAEAGRLERVVFDVQSRDLDPFTVLSRSGQKLRSLTAFRCEVAVEAVRGKPSEEGAEPAPDASWLDSNRYLVWDDVPFREWVAHLLEEGQGHAVSRLTRGIHREMKKLDTHHVLSISEMARNKEGDRFGHALMLAAAARMEKFPSRMVVGLLATGQEQRGRLEFHVWNEAWVSERWVPLDAWLGESPASVARIKIRDFDLRDEQPYEVMLSSLRLMRQLQISVKTVEKREQAGPDVSLRRSVRGLNE